MNWYVVPLSPAYALSLASLHTPDAIVTVYCFPLNRSELGLIVAAVPEYDTCPSPAAIFMAVLPAGVRTMLPVPPWIGSLKVRTMLVPALTAVAPWAGEKVASVGAVVSEIGQYEAISRHVV